MKKMYSEGYYVLCYDEAGNLAQELGPFEAYERAYRRMKKELESELYYHVEVAEKVEIR
jgi:hypothetical protein